MRDHTKLRHFEMADEEAPLLYLKLKAEDC